MAKGDFLFVLVGAVCEGDDIPEVESAARREYLGSLKNPGRKRESAYAWRLLELGLTQRLGISPKEADFRRLPSGAWESHVGFISISHTDGACAVAICSSPVGVDIERVRVPRAENFAKKLLTEEEYSEFCALGEGERAAALIRKWTEREAAFKAGLLKRVTDVGCAGISTRSFELMLNGAEYSLAFTCSRCELLLGASYELVNFS